MHTIFGFSAIENPPKIGTGKPKLLKTQWSSNAAEKKKSREITFYRKNLRYSQIWFKSLGVGSGFFYFIFLNISIVNVFGMEVGFDYTNGNNFIK